MRPESIIWYLSEASKQLGLGLQDDVLSKLEAYSKLLLKWNSAYNLTALRDEKDIAIKHFIDSLVVLKYIEKPISCLDVGTGAGFPGMVLAICRPDLKWTLLDANQKKIRFLRQLVHELALTNVTPVAARVEQFNKGSECEHGLDESRGYDWIICRAYSSIVNVCDQVEHLKTRDAELIAMKGVVPVEEIEQIKKLSKSVKITELNVPFLNEQRCLISIK